MNSDYLVTIEKIVITDNIRIPFSPLSASLKKVWLERLIILSSS